MQKILVLATRNQGKVQELRAMLADHEIEVKGLDDFPDCPEVVEDGSTFEENAIKKAETVARFLNLPALADDSGLEVAALGGRPGVYSARFAGPSATDEENNRKLLELMADVPDGKRQACFRSVLALSVPGKPVRTWEGVCCGEIIGEPRGTQGFGYDPLFFLPELGRTMGELSKEEKNRISHRGRAMQMFVSQWEGLLL